MPLSINAKKVPTSPPKTPPINDGKKVPASKPVTKPPTNQPIIAAPSSQPVTPVPTSQPVTLAPTNQPLTFGPSSQPTSPKPTIDNLTPVPTGQPVCVKTICGSGKKLDSNCNCICTNLCSNKMVLDASDCSCNCDQGLCWDGSNKLILNKCTCPPQLDYSCPTKTCTDGSNRNKIDCSCPNETCPLIKCPSGQTFVNCQCMS